MWGPFRRKRLRRALVPLKMSRQRPIPQSLNIEPRGQLFVRARRGEVEGFFRNIPNRLLVCVVSDARVRADAGRRGSLGQLQCFGRGFLVPRMFHQVLGCRTDRNFCIRKAAEIWEEARSAAVGLLLSIESAIWFAEYPRLTSCSDGRNWALHHLKPGTEAGLRTCLNRGQPVWASTPPVLSLPEKSSGMSLAHYTLEVLNFDHDGCALSRRTPRRFHQPDAIRHDQKPVGEAYPPGQRRIHLTNQTADSKGNDKERETAPGHKRRPLQIAERWGFDRDQASRNQGERNRRAENSNKSQYCRAGRR